MAWCIEISAWEWALLDDEEREIADGEIKHHALMVWERRTKDSVAIYGHGETPPPLLAELAERTAAEYQADA